ncbi:MAG: EI24 domain-containing protein [Pseudomonadota bacterium]
MIAPILAAIGQIGDPAFRSVLLRGVGLSVALLVGFSALFVWLARWLVGPSVTLPWIGTITWLDDVAGFALVPVLLVASVFLMVPVASAFTGLFLDRIADAVEAEHYPNLPAPRRQGWGEMLTETAQFLGIVIGANLLALIAYLAFAPVALFIFWAVNGFLLGREYAQLVAARHLTRAEAVGFRARHRRRIWLTGVLMAIPLSVPVLNLLVPVVGAAAFTHLYHRLNRAPAAP